MRNLRLRVKISTLKCQAYPGAVPATFKWYLNLISDSEMSGP